MENGKLFVKAVFFGLVVLMAGCANKDPLLFVSKQTVGVEISTPSTTDQAIGLVLGYKSLDAAYVPVVQVYESNDRAINVVSSSNLKKDEQPGISLLSAVNDTKQRMYKNAEKLGSAGTDEKPSIAADIRIDAEVLENLIKAQSMMPGQRDAFSVFSSFDSKGSAGTGSLGFGLGKIFATGIAAQNISKNYGVPYGVCSKEVFEAFEALSADEKNKKLGEALSEICPPIKP